MERRDFLCKGLPGFFFQLSSDFVKEAGFAEKEPKDYFDSYETAYPFLNEVTMEMLYQAAEQEGIDPAGKSKLELAREVYRHRGVVYHDG